MRPTAWLWTVHTDRAGDGAKREYAEAWPDRAWAVEGSNDAGRPRAQRFLEDGEQVVHVPAMVGGSGSPHGGMAMRASGVGYVLVAP
jgi:hypothetical protein